MGMSWREAIERVLREAKQPLHYAAIAEEISLRGYYKTTGATPDATVSATITTSINDEGGRSPFVRVDRGVYALRRAVTTPGVTASRPPSEVQASETGKPAVLEATPGTSAVIGSAFFPTSGTRGGNLMPELERPAARIRQGNLTIYATSLRVRDLRQLNWEWSR